MFKLVVLSCVLAAASASAIAPWGLGVAGLGWPGAVGLGWPGAVGHLAAPLVAPVAAPVAVAAAPVHGAYNYRGPLSLAPGQPANILAADGRPLDTLSVNLDRAAHYTARAVDAHGVGVHVLKKRSAPLLAPAVAWSHTARIDAPARIVAPAPIALRAPLAIAGVGPWGPAAWGNAGVWGPAGVWGHGAPLGRWW